MTDIGPMLREARMHAGLDIDDVEERTKIRAKYLRALENEEWALLPGSAFTKGFLRSYADVVGLDGGCLSTSTSASGRSRTSSTSTRCGRRSEWSCASRPGRAGARGAGRCWD